MHNPVTVIKIKDITLSVIYDKTCNGLYEFFSSDSKMNQFIQNDIEKAFSYAINKESNSNYILNIASTANLGAFEWKNEKSLLESLLKMFMPLLNKFIVEIQTNTL